VDVARESASTVQDLVDGLVPRAMDAGETGLGIHRTLKIMRARPSSDRVLLEAWILPGLASRELTGHWKPALEARDGVVRLCAKAALKL